MRYVTSMDSPYGALLAASDGERLTGLWFEGQKYFAAQLPETPVVRGDLPVFAQTRRVLGQYFDGVEPMETVPLAPDGGSAFANAVWEMLRRIPYGQTTTYGQLARQLRDRGVRASAQAVGGAVGHNPISILIPCHRVLGADGRLTGYAGGLEKKRALLTLEGASFRS